MGITIPKMPAIKKKKNGHVSFRAVGQLGRHTPDHAMAVAEADILRLYVLDIASH